MRNGQPNPFEQVARALGNEPLVLTQYVQYRIPPSLVKRLVIAESPGPFDRYEIIIADAVKREVSGVDDVEVSVCDWKPYGNVGWQFVHVNFKRPEDAQILPLRLSTGIRTYRGDVPRLKAYRIGASIGTTDVYLPAGNEPKKESDFAQVFIYPPNRSATVCEDHLHSTSAEEVLETLERCGIVHVEGLEA